MTARFQFLAGFALILALFVGSALSASAPNLRLFMLAAASAGSVALVAMFAWHYSQMVTGGFTSRRRKRVASEDYPDYFDATALSRPRKLTILAGVLLTAIGCTAPLVTLPIVGSISYVMHGRGDGVIVLGLAIIAGVLVFAGKESWAWLLGWLQLAAISFTFVSFQVRLNQLKETSELDGNPLRGLADAMIASFGFSWAWVPLVAGDIAVAFNKRIARSFA